MNMSVYLIVLVFFMTLGVREASAEKRVIAFGWDRPTPALLKNNIVDFEKNTSFTGFVITPTRIVNNQLGIASHILTTDKWHWEEFYEALVDLQQVKSPRLAQSFLLVSANPGHLDWFDDAVWSDVTHHWRLLARLAKQSGLKGLFFDLEPYYGRSAKQFCYLCQQQSNKKSFGDYKKMVRLRSAAIMQAVLEEFPAAEIFSTRLLSDLLQTPKNKQDAESYLLNNDYGLVPSLIDGWIDVLKNKKNDIVLIDGNEALSYLFNSEEDFRGGYSLLALKAPMLLDENNQTYFKRIFRVSHGIYLDAYLNDSKSIWFVDSKKSSISSRIVSNMSSAINNSDGMIWVYGEKGYWWKSFSEKYMSWSDKITGLSLSMQMLINNKPINTNGLFSKNKVNSSLWKLYKSDSVGDKGIYVNKKDGLFLSEVTDGCIGQSVTLTIDTLAEVSVNILSKETNKSLPYILIRWKDQQGKWLSMQYDVLLNLPTQKTVSNINQIYGFVRPPSNAANLIFLLCVKSQKSNNDDIYFQNPSIFFLN